MTVPHHARARLRFGATAVAIGGALLALLGAAPSFHSTPPRRVAATGGGIASYWPTAPRLASAHARGSAAARAADADTSSEVTDTLRLYYMGYAVGYERWTLAHLGDAGRSLTTNLDYIDRARRTRLRAELRMTSDWSPTQLEITRITDSTQLLETRVVIRDRVAAVDYRGAHAEVALPAARFAIAGHMPVTQHLALLRYWLAHGRPTTVAVVPGGPTNIVQVAWRGRDTLTVAGATTVLERFAVDGVVWGWESVWLDDEGRIAGFTTAGGGGLTLEAVRLALEVSLPQLRASATRDRLRDLAQLSRTVTPVASGSIALLGATLIDGNGGAAVTDAVVVVANGRVRAAGSRALVSIPTGARRIDATGKTIIPGLWDMHTHLMQMEWAPVYLAAGVTTVRDMGNITDFIIPLRAAVDSGRGLGPRMLLAGLIDGGGPNAFGAENAATADAARAVVRRYHDLAFDQIKLYSLLTPEVVGAITAEAHRLGMTVTGHIPTALTLSAAVDSGMDQVAHLPVRGVVGSDSVARQIAHLRRRGTVIDPTASWGELLQHSTAEAVASFQPGISQLPPVLAQRIAAMGNSTIDTATAHARLANTLGILRALHDAGVPVVAGTDEGVPGFSVYREVELYAAAGFSPMEALRAATAVSATAMGLGDQLGTLTAGKRADLLILDGNPLEQISNIRRVELVMKGGVLYRSSDLWRAVGFRPPAGRP